MNSRHLIPARLIITIRQQLEGLGDDIESHFDQSDETQREVLDAIIHQRDVFTAAFQDQFIFIQSISKQTRQQIIESHEETRTEARRVAEGLAKSNQGEHDQTRQEIRSEGEWAKIRSEESNAAAQRIESTGVEILHTIKITRDANQVEHGNTQSQIAELKAALGVLSEQMTLRNQELKDILAAFNESKNTKAKQQLSQRSNAVTAAILALETMYRSLKVSEFAQDWRCR